MSNKYKHGDRVPSDVLCRRLDELAEFVTKGPDAVRREFTMRVPAELDRDADLVISAASRRIKELEAALQTSLPQDMEPEILSELLDSAMVSTGEIVPDKPSHPQDVEEWMAKNKLWSITAREFSITTRSIRAFLAGKVLVPVNELNDVLEMASLALSMTPIGSRERESFSAIYGALAAPKAE